MLEVESRAIQAIDYKPTLRELFVTFRGGAAYCYAGVPAGTWNALLAAESIGRFLNLEIKPHYPATLLNGRSGSSPRSAA